MPRRNRASPITIVPSDSGQGKVNGGGWNVFREKRFADDRFARPDRFIGYERS
jgi:hypothetical protein